MATDTVLSLIDVIYSAASDPSLWPVVARQIQSAVGGKGLNFVLEDSSDDRFTCVFVNGVPKAEVQRYIREIKDEDALTGLMVRMPEGTAFMTQDYLDVTALHSSLYCREEFYEEVGYPCSNVGVFHNDGIRRGRISVARSKTDSPDAPEDQLLMQALIPHLCRALLINSQLMDAQLSSILAIEALEHVEAATVLIDDKGRVIQHNHRAETYLQNTFNSAIAFTFKLPDATANRSLHKNITAVGKGRFSDENNVITFLDQGAQKIALCLPWKSNQTQREWLGCNACCIVFILSPSGNSRKTSILKQSFGLSDAETKVLRELMDGKGASEVAELLFISEATVRFHIRNLLRKTNSRNQAELMANVFSLVSVGVE